MTRKLFTLQTNLAQNPGFEIVSPTAQYQPANWWSDFNSGSPQFPYNSPSDLPGRSGKGAAIILPATGSAYWAQKVSGLMPSSQYALTAYATTTNVSGFGAFLEIDWFDAQNTYISGSASTSTPLTGTKSWTQLSLNITAPPNAASANIILILNGSGTAVFDDVTFTGQVSQNNYGCVGSQCLPGYGTMPPGCNNICVTQPPPGGAACDPVTCPPSTNYCIFNTCMPKSYITYGAIAIGAIFIISTLK